MFQYMKQFNDKDKINIPVELGDEDFSEDMGIRINSKERIENAQNP